MAYSSIIKPSDYFNTLLYSGNSTARSLTGVGFEPSWVWIKERTSTSDHMLFDQPRGVQKYISSNLTNAEQTSASMLTAFGSDGFSLGNGNDVNDNGQTYASWNWKANGLGSANTDGTINTTYTSANTTSGFSISTYTGTGSNGTIGHGLGKVPKMLIIKNTNNTQAWMVYHASTGNNTEIQFNATGPTAGSSTAWQDTDPTNQVFYVSGSAGDSVNASGYTYVVYAFADIQGYSKFNSFIGNSDADGPFCYTGFKPAYVLLRNVNSTQDWQVYTFDMQPFNEFCTTSAGRIKSNTSDTASTKTAMDMCSNGFKIRTNAADINASGNKIIYMAFAESPFVANSGESIPTTAR